MGKTTRRALLAEMDRVNRAVMGAHLRAEGYGVRAVTGLQEALRVAQDSAFDLAVCDLEIPGMDGLELRRRLAKGAGRDVPILFLTERVDRPRESFVLRDAPLLLKPVPRTHLRAALAYLVSREERRMRREGATLSGSLLDYSIADLARFMERYGLSGRASFRADGRDGWIQFSAGQPASARAGVVVGVDAFHRLLRWNAGDFQVDLSDSRAERTIQRPLVELLLEGLARAEQWEALRGRLPKDAGRRVARAHLAAALGELPAAAELVVARLDETPTLETALACGAFESPDALAALVLAFEARELPLLAAEPVQVDEIVEEAVVAAAPIVAAPPTSDVAEATTDPALPAVQAAEPPPAARRGQRDDGTPFADTIPQLPAATAPTAAPTDEPITRSDDLARRPAAGEASPPVAEATTPDTALASVRLVEPPALEAPAGEAQPEAERTWPEMPAPPSAPTPSAAADGAERRAVARIRTAGADAETVPTPDFTYAPEPVVDIDLTPIDMTPRGGQDRRQRAGDPVGARPEAMGQPHEETPIPAEPPAPPAEPARSPAPPAARAEKITRGVLDLTAFERGETAEDESEPTDLPWSGDEPTPEPVALGGPQEGDEPRRDTEPGLPAASGEPQRGLRGPDLHPADELDGPTDEGWAVEDVVDAQDPWAQELDRAAKTVVDRPLVEPGPLDTEAAVPSGAPTTVQAPSSGPAPTVTPSPQPAWMDGRPTWPVGGVFPEGENDATPVPAASPARAEAPGSSEVPLAPSVPSRAASPSADSAARGAAGDPTTADAAPKSPEAGKLPWHEDARPLPWQTHTAVSPFREPGAAATVVDPEGPTLWGPDDASTPEGEPPTEVDSSPLPIELGAMPERVEQARATQGAAQGAIELVWEPPIAELADEDEAVGAVDEPSNRPLGEPPGLEALLRQTDRSGSSPSAARRASPAPTPMRTPVPSPVPLPAAPATPPSAAPAHGATADPPSVTSELATDTLQMQFFRPEAKSTAGREAGWEAPAAATGSRPIVLDEPSSGRRALSMVAVVLTAAAVIAALVWAVSSLRGPAEEPGQKLPAPAQQRNRPTPPPRPATSAEAARKDPQAARVEAQALYLNKRLPEAEAAYRALAATDPEDEIAHVNLASVLTDQKRLDEARAVLEAWVAGHPRSVEGQLSLAVLLHLDGKIDQARAAYEHFLESAPADHPEREHTKRILETLPTGAAP